MQLWQICKLQNFVKSLNVKSIRICEFIQQVHKIINKRPQNSTRSIAKNIGFSEGERNVHEYLLYHEERLVRETQENFIKNENSVEQDMLCFFQTKITLTWIKKLTERITDGYVMTPLKFLNPCTHDQITLNLWPTSSPYLNPLYYYVRGVDEKNFNRHTRLQNRSW